MDGFLDYSLDSIRSDCARYLGLLAPIRFRDLKFGRRSYVFMGSMRSNCLRGGAW